MRKILLCFITISLVLIADATRTPLFAAGNDNTGYIANSGDNITLTSRDVSPTTGNDALYAGYGGTITMNGGSLKLTTSSQYSRGAYADEGTIILNNVKIDILSAQSKALYAEGSTGSINMTGGSIHTELEESHGAQSWHGAITLTNVSIDTRAFGSHGLVAETGDSQITMNGGSITTYSTYVNASDQGSGKGAHGAFVNGMGSTSPATITLYGVDIITHGTREGGAYGLYANAGTIVMTGGSVHTLGQSSYGLTAQYGGQIDAAGITVKTETDRSHGVYAYYNMYGDISTVNLTDTTITTAGNEAAGLRADRRAEINMSGGSIATSGSEAYGAWCLDNSQIYLKNVGIKTTGSLADAVQVRAGGYLSMDAAVISVATSDAYAIRAYGTGASTISKVYGDASVFTIDGNIAAQDYSIIDLQMNNGSTFTGLTELGAANADLFMAITGANSVWNVTGNSALTDLILIDSSVDYRSSVLGTVITASNLNTSANSDGGYLTMKTDIVNENADLLKVTGTTDGDHTIRVVNVGSAATDGSEVTLLVDTADQNGDFNLYDSGVSLGGWYYELRKNTTDYGAGAGWELYATGASPGGGGGVNTFIANYLLGYAETQTLLQRLGDLRDTPKQSGLWFRLHGGKFVSNAKSYVNPFDFKYYGVQVGYDRKVAIDWEGDSYFGIMFGYSDSDLDYLNNGSGSVDSKTIALYWTSIKPGGFYLDAVIKYVWMENDYSVLDSEGTVERGNGVKTNGFGASLEFGERWHFAQDVRKGLYIEPQVQLSYQRQSGGHFMTSGGLEIGVRPYNSLIGRLGIQVGYDNLDSNFYLKVSREREFLGDLTVVANGVEFKERMKGSWWVYGLGCTVKANERNSFYLDLERASGGHFTKEWAAKAGWRTML